MLEKFGAAWENFDSPWTLEPGREVIDLGDSAFVPDFILSHPDGEQFYLEILGFWTPEHLQKRLREFAHAGVKNFIIAAWDELRGSRDPVSRVPPQAVIFKRNLDPVIVEMAMNDLLSKKDL
jgi:predicted nuclease of restriction endonuclease-like RecB superfamily